jgi:hypothetical protein
VNGLEVAVGDYNPFNVPRAMPALSPANGFKVESRKLGTLDKTGMDKTDEPQCSCGKSDNAVGTIDRKIV